MKILMVTNTYLPHVGGVARSIDAFSRVYRDLGHEVLVAAPQYPNVDPDEEGVVRVPAMQRFNGSDFSVKLPLPAFFFPRLQEFRPDIVHSHHPFLMGDLAKRISAKWNVPLIFTHHTMYEEYTHYASMQGEAWKRIVINLTTGYANLCQAVISPSSSVKEILIRRGVSVPISVIPTGVKLEDFETDEGREKLRERHGLPPHAEVIGYVGRLAREKNLAFLSEAVVRVMRRNSHAYFLAVGDGPSRQPMERLFKRAGLSGRAIFPGSKSGHGLAEAFGLMNVFAFSSLTETQGMVLAEALAAGVPVVALDAPGVRDIVRTGENGYLVVRHNTRLFASAIEHVLNLPPRRSRRLEEKSAESAIRVSIESCAERALQLYRECIDRQDSRRSESLSQWECVQRVFESQYDLLLNSSRAVVQEAGSGVWQPLFNLRMRLFAFFGRRRPGWRYHHRDGLIMVQIDGLARRQMERALAAGRLPFLRTLLRNEGYRLIDFYSGLPSTTPAVQAELMYGRKMLVPSFAYYNRKSRQAVRLIDPAAAQAAEELAAKGGPALLTGGSSYSNMYRGGAGKSFFCTAGFSWSAVLGGPPPVKIIKTLLLHFSAVMRALGLIALEVFLALADAVGGIRRGRNAWAELKFVPTRVGVSVFLREFITEQALADIRSGLPIIHVNFLGYDEQSHRRGPKSHFAHWTLKGIDHAIRKMWVEGLRSRKRRYEVWVYSDHGQEQVRSFIKEARRHVEEVVSEISGFKVAEHTARDFPTTREMMDVIDIFPRRKRPAAPAGGDMRVYAQGPLGHIYFEQVLPIERLDDIAGRLCREGGVPLACYRLGDQAVCYSKTGRYLLPSDGSRLFPQALPFSHEVSADFLSLIHHSQAGDIVISGYSPEESPLSFPREFGAHGGPGPNETNGFALLPESRVSASYVRPRDLRAKVLRYRRHEVALDERKDIMPLPGTWRVMTYNVHGCVGTDRRLSISRVAAAIARYSPDVVCLQEIDVGRGRSHGLDQAGELARALEMRYFFHPAFSNEGEKYGDAILSPHPMRLLRAGALPATPRREPRGVMAAEVDIAGGAVRIINTHCGLSPAEREQQVESLLHKGWIEDSPVKLVFCGDLNLTERSRLYRRLSSRLRDAGPFGARSWPSSLPFRRIDFIFRSSDLRVARAFIPKNRLLRRCSDHLPVLVDFDRL